MKDVLYEWVRNLVFYQVLTSIIINLMPSNSYVRYVRFFLGMLFIIIAIQPVMKGFHLAETMDENYVQRMIEQKMEENYIQWGDLSIHEGNQGVEQ